MHSLREFDSDEFKNGNYGEDSGIMSEESFVKCQGYPGNLIMLAFLLRKYKFNQIKIKLQHITKSYIFAHKYNHTIQKHYQNSTITTLNEELIKLYNSNKNPKQL